jgi:hypothetical protein
LDFLSIFVQTGEEFHGVNTARFQELMDETAYLQGLCSMHVQQAV